MMPTAPPRPEQLRMVWPEARPPPRFHAPAGYRLRLLRADEAGEHQRLLLGAGFADWTPKRTAEARSRALPGCFLAVEHRASSRLVATAMAGFTPLPGWPAAVELGWVAGDPAHANRGLGRAVCAGVLRRVLAAGHRCIYLKTDDFRLAAIRVYLRLGFEPALHAPTMAERWSAIQQTLGKGKLGGVEEGVEGGGLRGEGGHTQSDTLSRLPLVETLDRRSYRPQGSGVRG